MKRFKPCDGRPLPRYPYPEEIARFLSYCDIKTKSGHWLWTGYKDGDGYGQFWFAGRKHWASRWSQQVFNRELSAGMQANHAPTCRIASCVHPRCLGPLSVSENSKDGVQQREKKRRQRKSKHRAFNEAINPDDPDMPI